MQTLVILLIICFASCLILAIEDGDNSDNMDMLVRFPTKNFEGNREKRSLAKQENRQVNHEADDGDDGEMQESSIQTGLYRMSFLERKDRGEKPTPIQNVSTVPRKRRDILFPKLETTTIPSSLRTTSNTFSPIKVTSQGSFVLSTTAKPFFPNCSSSFSCRGRCPTNQTWFESYKDDKYFCYCDDLCEIFRDCCADFDLFCPSTNISLSNHDYSHWKCHSNIWMIDQCPKNWLNKELYYKCANKSPPVGRDNYVDVIPVVSRKNGNTYRNRFCAECHGEDSDNIEHYGLDFNCKLSPPQGYSSREAIEFLFEYCSKIQWRPKSGQVKRSCVTMEDQCYGTSDKETSRKCIQSPARLFAKIMWKDFTEIYKNIYCAQCLLSEEEIRNSLKCGPIMSKGTDYRPPLPFSIITDIGNNQMETTFKNQNVQVDCLVDEVYDIFLELCRPLSRPPSILISSHFDKYRIALWITFGATLGSRINSYNPRIVGTFFGVTLGLSEENIEITERKEATGKLDVLMLDLRFENRSRVRRTRNNFDQMSIDSLLNFTRPIRFAFQNDSFTIIKATSRLLTCVHVQYFTPEEYVVVHGSSSIYINHTQELLTEKQYFTNSTRKHNGLRLPVGSIAVCRQHLPRTSTCNGTYISLDKDEYVVLPNNSIYRNVSKTVYNQGEYSIINGSVVVCTEYSNKYTKTIPAEESQNDTALRILTYIGLSLSVVCLVFVLVTYMLFEELRTLPGINMMNLSSALLVAHLLWLIGSGQTGSRGACVAIAVLLHYSFLSSFVWMSIIAISTWKIFSSLRQAGTASDGESRKRKIRCALAVGWLPVLVLVLACLTLDQTGTVEIGYGGLKGCWINNTRANLFFFVIPISASLLWNAVFFGLTVRSLRKVTQQTRMVKEHRDYNTVYIKIAVLMGFTWIFGLFASFVSRYFLYPFVVLNTIQGVYIAACFTFTKRVKNLYTAFFGESKINKRKKRKTEAVTHLPTNTTGL